MRWLDWLERQGQRSPVGRNRRKRLPRRRLMLETLEDRSQPSASPWLAVGANVNISKAIGTQAESTIAINPVNSANLFTTDSQSDLCRFSMDGGLTWTPTNTSALSALKIYSNPAAAWDTFGNLFLVYQTQSNKIVVARSSDNGATLKDPRTVILNADQPSIAVGPGGATAAGSVWVSASPFSTDNYTAVGAAVAGLDSVGSFAAPETTPGAAGLGGFGGIAVGPNGQVLVTYQNDTSGAGPDTIHTDLDPDGLGPAGFNTVVAASSTNVGGFVYNIPAQASQGISANAGLAWDRSGGAHNGRVYLVYTDRPSTSSADTDIYVRSSDDNGTTWSSPVRVNDDPSGNGKSQFLPAIALDQTTGNIAVTWYDTRNSGVNNKSTQVFGAVSLDGGATWLSNVRISAGISNSTVDPAGFNFGNYDTMDFSHGAIYRGWADNSNITWDNPNGAANGMNIVTAKVSVVTTVSPASAVTVGGNVNITKNTGSDGETTVAVNPANPLNLFESDTRSVIGHYSLDGGRHWSVSDMSQLPTSVGDVEAAFDSFGNLFLTYLGPGTTGKTYVAWSFDGGATFPGATASPSQLYTMPNSAGSDQPNIATGPSATPGIDSVWISVNNTRYAFKVDDVWVTNGGSGYTSPPTVSFDNTGTGGSGAAATANISGGVVTSITMTSHGSGYNSDPIVTLSGGGGTGATATAIGDETVAAGALVTGLGQVGAFNPPEGGTGLGDGSSYGSVAVGPNGKVMFNYQNRHAPNNGPDNLQINLNTAGTGLGTFTMPTSPTGGLTGVVVTSVGSGYTSAPNVIFDNTRTGGSGAAATAVINSTTGTVTAIILTNPGLGYLLAPTVTLQNGGGSGAAATATVGAVTPTNVGPFGNIPAVPNRSIDAQGNLAWDYSGGPHNNRLYLVYVDRRNNATSNTDIFVRYSDNDGANWSSPLRIDDDTGNHSHFNPAIAVDQTTGYVAITWYDTRHDPTNVMAEIYGTMSADGGVTWLPSLQIAAGPSDATTTGALDGGDFNFGDYDTMDFNHDVFYRTWADNSNSTGDNPNGQYNGLDVYTAPVTIPTTSFKIAAPPIVTAGTPFSITVSALDAWGNTDTGYSGTAQFTSTDLGTGVALPSPQPFTIGDNTHDNGTHTFANLVKLITGGSQTITVKDSVTGTIIGTATVIVAPATADHLKFSVQPSNVTAGVAIGPSVQVGVFDQYGNLETGDNTDQVTLTVASGPGNFTGSTTMVTVGGGVANFGNLVLDTAGNYTLGESATGGLTGANSSTFAVSPGPVSLGQSVVSVSPAAIKTGSTATVTLQAKDAYGNNETGGGLTVGFVLGGGSATGTFGPVTGTYTAVFTGGVAGTNTISATINGSRLTSAPAPITVDDTPPTAGTVNDGLGADIDEQPSLTTIAANWSGFTDADSGIASYQWAIGTTAGATDVQGFTDVGNVTSASASGLSLIEEGTYYSTVRAIDRAGNVGPSASSDGVTVEPAGVTVTPTAGLVTTAAGGVASFSVVLDSTPTDNVTIGLTSSNPALGTLSTSVLTFTPASATTPQVFTITGHYDGVADGNETYTIVTAPATSNDLTYNGLNPADLTVTSVGFLAKNKGTFTDQDGDIYTVRLTGPGQVGVLVSDPNGTGKGPIERVVLHGTDPARSSLSITVKKAKTTLDGGRVSIDRIEGSGLKSISAKASDLVGDGVNLTGLLGRLVIHDVQNGAKILAAGLPTQKTTIVAHEIGDGTTIDVGSQIASLSAARVGVAAIVAPSIGSLRVTGDKRASIPGDFRATVTLSDVGVPAKLKTLNSVRIAGAVMGSTFDILAGNVGAVTVGSFTNSQIYLGFTPTTGSDPMAGGTFASTTATLTSFHVTAVAFGFANSVLAAPIVGMVNLKSAVTGNGGVKFGVLGGNIRKVAIASPSFKFDPKGPALQSIDDLEVKII